MKNSEKRRIRIPIKYIRTRVVVLPTVRGVRRFFIFFFALFSGKTKTVDGGDEANAIRPYLNCGFYYSCITAPDNSARGCAGSPLARVCGSRDSERRTIIYIHTSVVNVCVCVCSGTVENTIGSPYSGDTEILNY